MSETQTAEVAKPKRERISMEKFVEAWEASENVAEVASVSNWARIRLIALMHVLASIVPLSSRWMKIKSRSLTLTVIKSWSVLQFR